MMLMSYLFARSYCPEDASLDQLVQVGQGVPLVVEGDDSLMESITVNKDVIARLGLMLKMEHHRGFHEASFCGIRVALDSMQNVVDPRRVYAELGTYDPWWAGASDRVLKSILRCKGMSIIAATPACPIVTELGRYAVRVTADVAVDDGLRSLDSYKARLAKSEKWGKDDNLPISDQTRVQFAHMFGISVEEQFRMEAIIRDTDSLSLPWLDMGFRESWYDYARTYVGLHSVMPEYEHYSAPFAYSLVPGSVPRRKKTGLPTW
jgi:hypothetical protein